ncbi:BadF/BadG/BcrA/BcrD ATPase family protein [Spirosoma endbachense]|uniref:N-acetylglucosamine kinase n=1 Tax=Spirosoma endbachense TaxID=2666025 RepID=A0A6P1VQG7_9BACT|nr:BadF/BadG/BcrA/BcrD ATPase family protein [Spirosoma endbachense]QHV95501.1 N-acetylglucosamine kinase [Spirosoma endbachense]
MNDILIADSGSTKTDWRLVRANGVTRAIQTNGFNPYYQTTEQIISTLQAQLLPELSGATITSAFFYGAGCSGPPVNYIISDALRAVLPDLAVVEVNSDMLGAARGATGREPGIVCILGTGSNACCYDGHSISRGIQTLGFWLGDEGSGGYLGKTIVRDFFQERLPVHLKAAFQKRYALDRPTLLENAYQKPFPNRYFASFTPFLSEHIADAYIDRLVTDAFTLFLSTYVTGFPEADLQPVHFVGSIAHYFAEQLHKAVKQTGLTMGRILKAPATELVDFHRQAV